MKKKSHGLVVFSGFASVLAASSALASVTLTPVAIGFNNPISVDFHQPTGKVILSTNYPFGEPYNFELVASDGTRSQFSSVHGLSDEVYVAAVRSTHAGFTAGELFVGTGVPGTIARISPDGSSIQNPWVVLPGEFGLLRGALHIDETGVFGGDLIVATDSGAVWRVDAAGTPTRLGSALVPLEGLITLPLDARYGPWAGKAVSCNEGGAGFFAFDPLGQAVDSFGNLGMPACENLNVVPPNQFFYGVDFASRILWVGAPAQFTSMVGDVVVGEEAPGNLWHLVWDASAGVFHKDLLATVSQFEGAAFAPTALPTTNHSPTVACPVDQTRECGGPAGAATTLAVAVDDPDHDPLTVTWTIDGVLVATHALAAGAGSDTLTFTFALGGSHTVALHVDDGKGGVADCSTAVTVVDTTPPTLTSSTSVQALWPPEHDLINVGFTAVAGDVCDSAAHTTGVVVYSNEADEEDTGGGRFSPDAKGFAAGALRLRAERKGNGTGRVYLIVTSAVDASGHGATACSAVVVPHDQAAASIASIDAAAASAVAFCGAHGGAAPPGYVPSGVGPVVGPKQ
ncbi:MAG TPA: hypothetical protein VNO55_23945 [Polyangia bacterium]|nr:hypothetical protein [Polyangia bacterium]